MTVTPERRALAAIVTLALLALVSLFVFDAALFRTGWYANILEPDSSAGQLEMVLRAGQRHQLTAPHRVLVLGDSQMGEGFSAQLADAAAGPGWQFTNAAVAGTTPRSWFYLVRDLDPQATRYNIVLIPLDDYEDLDTPLSYEGDHWTGEADRELDAHWLAARLRLDDALTFASSYASPLRKLRVFRDLLFKGLLFRGDFRALIRAGLVRGVRERWQKVRLFHAHFAEWQDAYEGNTGNVDGLSVDWATGGIRYPANLSPSIRQAIAERYQERPEQTGRMTRYRRRWLGALLDRYRRAGAEIVICRPPQWPLAPPRHWSIPAGAFVLTAGTIPGVKVLDEHLFDSLQTPANFFDGRHLNAAGRRAFSARLAQAIAAAGSGGGGG